MAANNPACRHQPCPAVRRHLLEPDGL